MYSTHNTRVHELKPLLTPKALIETLPLSEQLEQQVTAMRTAVSDILHGRDQRLLVIAGPCSIHDYEASLDYANRLKQVADKLSDDILILMRVYFEKPRTTIGWKGFINDPDLDNGNNINEGLRLARQLLVDINRLNLPVATEFLDTMIPQYTADLISWAAIGARTTESQLHRNLASGLSMPVGFKNGTTGDIKIAVDAAYAASNPHTFLGITEQGSAAIVTTCGNADSHIILRGGSYSGPNYMPASVQTAKALLADAKINRKIIIDCSHGNSNKDHTQQKAVATHIIEQFKTGVSPIAGIMLESNLVAGKQPLSDKKALTYGQSITDPCLGWDETERLLTTVATTLQARRG